ncbi:hypothetical protein J6590_041076 [Homalodisca vitripennis]|nr:hypothetical protein J6590_041076 [Homalodisca vitripennis]
MFPKPGTSQLQKHTSAAYMVDYYHQLLSELRNRTEALRQFGLSHEGLQALFNFTEADLEFLFNTSRDPEPVVPAYCEGTLREELCELNCKKTVGGGIEQQRRLPAVTVVGDPDPLLRLPLKLVWHVYWLMEA